MKIKVIDKKILPVDKAGTKVGELYQVTDGISFHLRCQGGFVNLGSGAYTAYEIARDDACWVHLPNAELTIQ